MSETELQASIMSTLDALGFPTVRVHSGRVRVRGGWMQLAPEGTPDLVVLEPYLWLEVKLPKGRVSDVQLEWHEKASKLGVKVVTVRSVSEAVDAVRLRRAAMETYMQRLGEKG